MISLQCKTVGATNLILLSSKIEHVEPSVNEICSCETHALNANRGIGESEVHDKLSQLPAISNGDRPKVCSS